VSASKPYHDKTQQLFSMGWLELWLWDKHCRKFSRNISSGVNFINVLRTDFTLVDPKSVKNTVKSSVSSYAFGICKSKSCMYNVDEIEPRSFI